MRATISAALWTSVFVLAVGCGGKSGGDDDDDDGPDACVGIECQVVNCGAMGLPNTSISGTVFAPNGTLPLNGVTVYVNRDPLPPFQEGVTCDRCSTTLPGSAVAQTTSDAFGNFKLDNVPAGDNIPLVITTGKWRRQVTIPVVNQCSDTAVGSTETRLPKNKSEGDIPKIAITTGNADSMECLARKLGVEDTEITGSAGQGRIHLYAGNGVDAFKSGFAGGGNMTGAEPFWSNIDTLKTYDIVILSCEGAQLQGATSKSQGALDAMKGYADVGGRVFASHWHNIWISGKFQGGVGSPTPQNWNTIGDWEDNGNFDGPNEFIDEVSNPKGSLFADWMVNVGGSSTRGIFPITQGRDTSQSIDTTRAEMWVRQTNANGKPQMFQFTTPQEVATDQRCGKVVFTDMHVSGSIQNGDYPDSCVGGANNLDLTPQEKALAFMFFDIASCVGGLF